MSDSKRELNEYKDPAYGPDLVQMLSQLVRDYQDHLLKDPKNESNSDLLLDDVQASKNQMAIGTSKSSYTASLLTELSTHNMPGFLKLFGECERSLVTVSDYNPATSIGLIATHGKALVDQVHELIPNLDSNPHYLIGKAIDSAKRYLVATQQIDPSGDEVKQDGKFIETPLMIHCKALIDYLNGGNNISEKLAVIQSYRDRIKEEVNRINKQNSGFFSTVKSIFAPSYESQLNKRMQNIAKQVSTLNMTSTVSARPRA